MADAPGGQSGGALATLGPIANTTIAAAAHAHVAGPQGVEGFVSIPSQGTTDTTLPQRIVTRGSLSRHEDQGRRCLGLALDIG